MFLGNQFHVLFIYRNLPTPLCAINSTMDYVLQAKSLGVILNSTLTWSRNLPGISQGVHRTLRLLNYYKRSLKFSLWKCLVESLIFPIFDFAAVVYHSVFDGEELKLQRFLNACVCFVFVNISRTAYNISYRLSLGWFTPRHRWDILLAAFTFSVVVSTIYRCICHASTRF